MAKRVSIPKKLAAQVEYSSDRTCCICRIPDKATQIHHIDEDPSNKDIDNLAVLCLECHNQTQVEGGFARHLTPEQVELYNSSWRQIVKDKLHPSHRDVQSEYQKEVYLEIGLACHTWKTQYLVLYPGGFREKDTRQQYVDVWDKMEKTGKHIWSDEEWIKYRPLFDGTISSVIAKLQSVFSMHSDVIAPELKVQMIRAVRQLEAERFVYLAFPSLSALFQDKDQHFNVRFSEVIRLLAHLDRETDQLQNAD